MLEIRPHHLLCSLGYRGVNYNPESANNWANVLKEIRSNPDLKFKVVLQEDAFCKECTHSNNYNKTCDKNFVQELDNKIKSLLSIKEGDVLSYREIINKLFSIFSFEKQKEVCQNCGWWKKGLCHDIFRNNK